MSNPVVKKFFKYVFILPVIILLEIGKSITGWFKLKRLSNWFDTLGGRVVEWFFEVTK